VTPVGNHRSSGVVPGGVTTDDSRRPGRWLLGVPVCLLLLSSCVTTTIWNGFEHEHRSCDSEELDLLKLRLCLTPLTLLIDGLTWGLQEHGCRDRDDDD